MGRDALIEKLIETTTDYWDGYYLSESAFEDVRERMKKVLDKQEKG